MFLCFYVVNFPASIDQTRALLQVFQHTGCTTQINILLVFV